MSGNPATAEQLRRETDTLTREHGRVEKAPRELRRRKNMHKERAARVLRSLWEMRNDARVAVEHPVRSL
jgi:hypothetical protein